MKYDHDEIIEKATTRQRGFQEGMRDIQQALDMRPGSIYAFSKQRRPIQICCEHYADNSAKRQPSHRSSITFSRFTTF